MHPGVRSTPEKKNFDPPGEAIFLDFLAKSPPGLLNKHPTEKDFSPPGGGAGEKIFLKSPPGVDPPLVPKPVPTYDCGTYGRNVIIDNT